MQRSGILHKVQRRVTIFDPKVYHAVKPWVGERMTLAVYSTRGVWSIPKRLRVVSAKVGFPGVSTFVGEGRICLHRCGWRWLPSPAQEPG